MALDNHDQLKKIIQENINIQSTQFVFNKNKLGISSSEVQFCAEQIFLRQKYSDKFPDLCKNFDFIFTNRLACEQSSSEYTAKYKSTIINNFILNSKSNPSTDFTSTSNNNNNILSCSADLTGGLGVDSFYIAQKSKKHFYCEINENIFNCFCKNIKVLNYDNITATNSNARDFLINILNNKKIDLIYIDPDRRDISGKRKILLEDLSPNILELQDIFKKRSNSVLIKLSPIFDISQIVKKLRNICEVHIVSVENECKELLVLLNYTSLNFDNCDSCVPAESFETTNDNITTTNNNTNNTTTTTTTTNNNNNNNNINISNIKYSAVNISKNNNYDILDFLPEQNKPKINYSLPQKYIYEPNASLMKLGFWNAISKNFNISKLHQNSHLFTSNRLVENFQGRKFKLLSVENFSKEAVQTAIGSTKKANISIRNFPYTTEEIKKKLNLTDGGDYFLFATTLLENKLKILITKKVF